MSDGVQCSSRLNRDLSKASSQIKGIGRRNGINDARRKSCAKS